MSDEMTKLLARGTVREAATRPPKSSLRLWLAVLGLLAYVSVIVVVTLSPTPLDQGYGQTIDRLLGLLHRNGVPGWFDYGVLELSANVAMFVPLGFLLGLALPRKWQWLGIILVPAFSASIEFAQGAFLSARFSSPMDIATNTAGGLAGLLVAALIRAAVYARDEKVIARAMFDARHGAPRR